MGVIGKLAKSSIRLHIILCRNVEMQIAVCMIVKRWKLCRCELPGLTRENIAKMQLRSLFTDRFVDSSWLLQINVSHTWHKVNFTVKYIFLTDSDFQYDYGLQPLMHPVLSYQQMILWSVMLEMSVEF